METVDYNIICEEDKNMQYIDLYWMNEYDYAVTNAKDGNAYGAYGFDRRHSLVQFMKYCIEYDAYEFDLFEPFAALGSGSPKLQNNEELATVWKNIATDTQKYPDFINLQNQYAYEHYYLLATSNCLKVGLDVDKYSPILRGTLWFLITKFGISSGTKKLLFPFKQGVTDELEALHMIFSNNTSIDTSIYNKATEAYKRLNENASSKFDLEPEKETNEKIKTIDMDNNDEFEESPIIPEKTVISKTPGEIKKPIDLGEMNDRISGLAEDEKPTENKITKDHVDIKLVNKTTASKETKKSFDKKAEFKVCEDWKQG